jgi:hypothetical protein
MKAELQKVVAIMNSGAGNGDRSDIEIKSDNKDETDNTMDPKASCTSISRDD